MLLANGHLSGCLSRHVVWGPVNSGKFFDKAINYAVFYFTLSSSLLYFGLSASRAACYGFSYSFIFILSTSFISFIKIPEIHLHLGCSGMDVHFVRNIMWRNRIIFPVDVCFMSCLILFFSYFVIQSSSVLWT